MRRVELRRLVDFLLGASEERTPIKSPASTSSFGTMGIADDKEPHDLKGESVGSGMSWSRKLAFLLSLQGGVVYVLALAWWIPCRDPLCDILKTPQWTANLTSAALTSNVDTSESSTIVGLSWTGSSDNSSFSLAALRSLDGAALWNKTLPVPVRHVFCRFEGGFHADRDGKEDVVVSAFEMVAAFAPSDGRMIWTTHLFPSGETVHETALLSKSLLLCAGDSSLLLLECRGGLQRWAAPLPCSWAAAADLAGPLQGSTGRLWAVVCQYGDAMEVWSVDEKDLLKKWSGRNLTRTDLNFSKVLSRTNSGADSSIALSSDLDWTLDTLAVTWGSEVILSKVKGQRLAEAWHKSFLDGDGLPLPLTSVVLGHFTQPFSKLQLAVSIKDEDNSSVRVLELSHGRTLTAAHLDQRWVVSAEKIGPADRNTLVLETVSSDESGNNRTYFSVHWPTRHQVMHRTLLTAQGVEASSLIPMLNGISQLLLAGHTLEGSTYVTRHLVAPPITRTRCHLAAPHSDNSTNYLLMD